MTESLLTGPIPSFTKKLTAYRSIGILVGDTLQRIAARELGNAALWYDLANVNALIPPYIVDDPALVVPGVLLSGQDTLKVPSPTPAATGVYQAVDVFGTDCVLVNRQITADASGDIATVKDKKNLKQALEMRLGTHPGDLVYHTDYGCRAYTLLGRGSTPVSTQLAAAFVAKAINSDSRVSRAIDTIATTTGDQLAAKSTAIAVDGKRLTIGLGSVVTT